MHWKFAPYLFAVIIAYGIVASSVVVAEEDPQSVANAAVAGILFDYGAEEFTSYRIRDDGFADITFARNTPDALYSEILNKLQHHPGIPGVLAGKGGPVCRAF
jgi:hypothetical protein